MIFTYKSLTQTGETITGTIDAPSKDEAVTELQRRNYVVVTIEEKKTLFNFDRKKIPFLTQKIKSKDIVIFSRQIATLFEAGVSALKAFRILAEENENHALSEKLTIIADDIQTGVSLSKSLEKHPEMFTPFYVSMIRSGEESGKLNEAFLYLADYLDRDYELTQKTKKALTYPAFVIGTFLIIMTGMFVFVIPKMASMFAEQGTELPLVTRIVLGISEFFINFSYIIFPALAIGGWFFYRYSKTKEGRYMVDSWKIKVPVSRNLFQKIFLARLADNMDTMLTSGVSIIRAIEITADVVDNDVYKELLLRVSQKVKAGTPFSKALYEESEVPSLLVQMVRIGEETGELGYILKNLAKFYKREVDSAVDTAIGLLEPAMIVGLGVGVGVLVASVILPMYTLSSSIS